MVFHGFYVNILSRKLSGIGFLVIEPVLFDPWRFSNFGKDQCFALYMMRHVEIIFVQFK